MTGRSHIDPHRTAPWSRNRKHQAEEDDFSCLPANSLNRDGTMASRKFWIVGAMSLAILAGIAGGLFGALLSTTASPLDSTTTSVTEPVELQPGTPILLLNKGVARAVVKVDRNGLILLNFTTRTGQNRIALGVLGDSKLGVGVFDSVGKPKAAMEVPMKDSGRVHLLLNRKQATPAAPAHHHLAS